MAAVEQVLERAGARADEVDALRARHDGRHQRAARGARRAHRAGHDRGLRGRARDRPPGAAGALPAVRASGPHRSCPPSCASGSRERIAPRGRRAAARRRGARGASLDAGRATPDVESVAVCLLHSYADPRARAARRGSDRATRLPDVHVSASHDVLGVFREYERTSTTVIDAYLSPLSRRYLERLVDAPPARPGCPSPEIMQLERRRCIDGRGRGAACRLDGALRARPAGAVGAALVGRARRREHVVSFDMGGTSCDVAVIDGGRVAPGREPGDRRAGACSFRWWTCTPSARAAGASAGRIPAARCGSARSRPAPIQGPPATDAAAGCRRSRTRTSCSATSSASHRWPAASALDRAAAERAVASLGREARADAARGGARASCASPTRRWRARCES